MFVKMKLEREFKGILATLLTFISFGANADTWYPAGNNNFPAPVAVYANGDFFITLHKTKSNIDSFDYYTPAKYDGKIWLNLPQLKVYAGSEISSIIRFGEEVIVGGSFMLPARKFNNLVHLNLLGKGWEGFGLFSNGDTTRTIVKTLEVFNGDLYAGGKFKIFKGALYNNILRFNKVFTPFALEKNSNIGITSGEVSVLSSNVTSLLIGGEFTNLLDDKAVNNMATVTYNAGVYAVASKPAVMKGRVKTGKWFNGNFYFLSDNLGIKGLQVFAPGSNAATSINSNISFINNFGGFFVYENKLFVYGELKISGVYNQVVKLDGTTWLPFAVPAKFEYFAVFQNRLLGTGYFQGFSIRPNPVSVLQLLGGIIRISGRVYQDFNSNCIGDGNDKPIAGRYVIMAGQRNSITRTDANGLWEFLISASTNTVSFKAEQPKYWTKPGCETAIKTLTLSGHDTSEINFASIVAMQASDLQVTLTSDQGWHARKDFREAFNIKIQNNGTLASGGVVTFKYDRKIEGDVNFSIPPDKTGTNELSWNIASLKPGEERNIQVYPLIKSSQLNLNDKIQSSVSVTLPNDQSPNDNTDTLKNLISGNTATFGKYASPNPTNGDTSMIAKGQDEIRYTISFENTGTDTVRTVRVIDTLDLTYYIGYTQETGASHPYTTYMYQDPSNIYKGIFIWTFNNINLAPNPSKSQEVTNSRGYIGFKVKFDPNTPSGTLVKNTANVVFDQGINNYTNSVWCKYDDLQNGTGVKPLEVLGMQVYPNPANQVINLKFVKPFHGKAELTDLSGKTLVSLPVNGEMHKTIATESFANGIYLIKLSGKEGTSVVKTAISR